MAKIVIVEDNELNMRLFSDLLKTKGYQVIECTEGKKALAVIKKHKPDVVLMDIQMPEVDGLTVTRMVRETPAVAHTKIIAVTAFAMTGDAERILKQGCNAYIAKPISIPTFFKTVDEVLNTP